MPPRKNNRKKPRKENYLIEIRNKYYIFCEGTQTEPQYFRGFEKAIKDNPIYKNLVHIQVEGVGAETLRVINAAENFAVQNNIDNAEIWCVYDKDSFPPQDFNSVETKANTLNSSQTKVKYKVAWSNQCIEYWFILHFDWYDIDNDRKDYRQYLHTKFHNLGLSRYQKNDPNLFTILTDYGDPKQAIKRARKRMQQCSNCTCSNSVPATKVYLLIEELAKYLPEKLKVRYLKL